MPCPRILCALAAACVLATSLATARTATSIIHGSVTVSDPGTFPDLPSAGTDWSTFSGRKDWLLGLNWSNMSAHAKFGMSFNLANLYQFPAGTPQSNRAVAYTVQVLGPQLDTPAELAASEFFPLGVVRAIYQYGDRFTSAQMSQIGTDAQRMYYWYGGGTENHHLLRLSNAYLLAQKFPSGQWHTGGSGSAKVSSATLLANSKEKLRNDGRLRYDRSFNEASSPNYVPSHLIPLLNLYDFAQDPEVKRIAEATLLHLLAHLSVNVYRGYILDPYNRFLNSCFTNGGTGPGAEDGYKNAGLLVNWLYWNQFTPGADRFAKYTDNDFLIYPALSGYRPPDALERIANLSSDNPGKAHWVLTSEPEWAAGPNQTQDGRIIDAMRRRVWRDKEFAIGSGVGYWVPGSTYMQSGGKFGIAYRSTDRLHYIQAGHPYSFADEEGLKWWQAPHSPFMQVAHHKNTAILMFNIPQADPWPNIPSQRRDFWETDRARNPPQIRRSEHFNSQRTECAMRYPLTMDETAEVINADGTKWYFLREGETYIGIRTLTTPLAAQQDTFWKSLFAGAELHGGRSQSGFVVEVASSIASGGQFADFSAFKSALTPRQPIVAWGSGSTPSLSVLYTSSEGVTLQAEYDTNLDSDSTDTTFGKVRMFPTVKVNGVLDDSEPNWPDIDARLDATHPLVTMVEKMLTIYDPDTGALVKRIAWSGSLPVFSPITLASVSAASFKPGALAPESIVAAFGVDLSPSTDVASSSPLPMSLGGTTVSVRDSANNQMPAPLFFVSPEQINFLLPAGLATGDAILTVANAGGGVATSPIRIAPISPALFAANADGQGVAAAVVLRIKADGSQSYEPVAAFDQALGKFVAAPIDLGPETDEVFLVAYGTGIRGRNALSGVSARIGGIGSEVLFAGAATGFFGLDQLNARLLRSLIGRGEADFELSVDGQTANVLKLRFK